MVPLFRCFEEIDDTKAFAPLGSPSACNLRLEIMAHVISNGHTAMETQTNSRGTEYPERPSDWLPAASGYQESEVC